MFPSLQAISGYDTKKGNFQFPERHTGVACFPAAGLRIEKLRKGVLE
jgi:hypothetical protein